MPIIVQRKELSGQSVVLRPNAPTFSAQLHAAAMESLDTVGRWMPWCHAERTEAEGLEWYKACEENWDADVEYEFSAFSLSGAFLGAGGLNQFNHVHNFANLGYWVRQSRQGEGFAVEIATLLADFGFNTLHLSRIEIVVAEHNRPSRRVAEKVGARFEGIAQGRILLRGTAIDAAMYSLVPGGGR